MFASRDRPAKANKNASEVSLSNGLPGKQVNEVPHTNGVASTATQQNAEVSRPQNLRTVTHHTAKNDAVDTAQESNPDINILVKSTREVSTKYESQLRTVINIQELTGNSVKSVLDFIAADRLRRVPHSGSRWDRILRLAEHFAIRISLYQDAVGRMFPGSSDAAGMIWGSCGELLKVGGCFADLAQY